MQTFLPYPDFEMSAAVLDGKRLGKQRVETLQILTALLTGAGWVNHPATRMWRGYEHGLVEYQRAVTHEWTWVRGYRDTCWEKTRHLYFTVRPLTTGGLPHWFGDEEFHISHQSNLIRKDPSHYGPLFPGVPDNLPYIWPT